MKPVQIYAICHPVSGEVRYIGKANDAAKRFASHLRENRRNHYPLYRWIASLSVAPSVIVLAESIGDWRDLESQVISQYRAWGYRLLNVANGGDEPYCSVEQRAINGRANSKSLHSDPVRKRIWALKQKMGKLLRDGHVSEEVKAKLRYCANLRPDLFGAWRNI
jgi:hypothetical protein